MGESRGLVEGTIFFSEETEEVEVFRVLKFGVKPYGNNVN